MTPHLLLLALLLPAALNLPGEPTAAPAWFRAYLFDGEVCFEPPQSINWEKVAEQHFIRFPPGTPDRDALAANWNEVARRSTFTYPAPLPDGFPNSGYTLLAESGLQALRLSHLRGEVGYDLLRPGATPEAPMFYGYVCGMPEAPISDAGFVTTRPLHPGAAHGLPVPPPELGPSAVKAAFTIVDSVTGAAFLFVRRVSDEACIGPCCEYSYDLFSLGSDVTRVLANAYSCDP